MLDDLGLLLAIEAWLERRRGGGLLIASEFPIPAPEQGRTGLDPELETTIYRLLQEALTGKHAGACPVCVQVAVAEGLVKIEVQDDGVGFDLETETAGFGLAGDARWGDLPSHLPPDSGSQARTPRPSPRRTALGQRGARRRRFGFAADRSSRTVVASAEASSRCHACFFRADHQCGFHRTEPDSPLPLLRARSAAVVLMPRANRRQPSRVRPRCGVVTLASGRLVLWVSLAADLCAPSLMFPYTDTRTGDCS